MRQPDLSPRVSRPVVVLLLVGAASMVAQGFGRFTYPVLVGSINADLLNSYTRAGVLGSVSLFAYLLGTAGTSYASTRFEPIALVRVGIVCSLGGLGLLAVAPGFGTLAVGLFLAGLGGALVWIPAPGIAAAVVGPSRAGFAIGLVGAGIGMGIVVAGPLTNAVRAVAGPGAWRPVYVVQAAVAAVVLAGLVLVVRHSSGSAKGERAPLSVLRVVPRWPLLLAAFATFGVAYSLFFYFLVAQLEETGWSESASALIFALVGACSVFGGIAFGRLSDSIGRPAAMALGFGLLAVAPILTLAGHGATVIAGAVCFGLCIAGTPTAIGAVLADRLSGRAFGAAFGTLTLVFGVAQLLGPPFAGFMGERFGSFTVPFLLSSGFALVGVGIAWGMRRPVAVEAAPSG